MANRFSRKNKETINESSSKVDGGYLLESDQSATINGHLAYNFLQGVRNIDGNYINNDLLLEKMCQDAVIAAALDIWTEDALQKDPLTGKLFTIEVDKVKGDVVSKELSQGLSEKLTNLLAKDLRVDKYLATWCKRVLKYGNCILKLDFADLLTDEKLKLIESSVSSKDRYTKVANKLNKMFESADSNNASIDSLMSRYNVNSNSQNSKLNNLLNITDTQRLNEAYAIDYEDMMKKVSDVTALKEEILGTDKEEKTVKGRWFTEIIGHGTNIYELSTKQKVVAYIDRDATNKFIKPDNIINFSNNSGKHRVSFEVGDVNDNSISKEYYSLERGEGFLENAMVAWQVLSALEDILLLTRMTRSILYRIFSVEVGNKGNKETALILDRLKNRLKMEETIDVRSKIYSSTLAQVPLADSVFIPTHNGVGVVSVNTVGGDINLKDAIDLDYFRDKLHSALRIPAPYLSYTESLPGGIGDSSLTRMDIRYSRTITRIKTILEEGMKDICLRYLELTIGERGLRELPNFRVKLVSTNSSEDYSRAELQQMFMDTLNKCLEALNNLGINMNEKSEMYAKTREILISRYFGADILDAIKEDELLSNVTNPEELDSESNSAAGGDIEGPSTEVNVTNTSRPPMDMDIPDTDIDTDTPDLAAEVDTDVDTNTNELS